MVSLVRLLSGLAKRFASFMREMDLGLAVMHSQQALLGRSGERRGGGLREDEAIGGEGASVEGDIGYSGSMARGHGFAAAHNGGRPAARRRQT